MDVHILLDTGREVIGESVPGTVLAGCWCVRRYGWSTLQSTRIDIARVICVQVLTAEAAERERRRKTTREPAAEEEEVES